MKTKKIVLIIILATIALGIGLFIWQNYVPKQAMTKHGHHEIWYCPMHPWILYDHPGRCPICGMDLVKKVDAPQQQGSAIEGYTNISVTTQRQQLAGVRTAVVNKRTLLKTIRTAGEYQGEVYAQVFEEDIGLIKVGQRAIVEIPARHQKYEGIVRNIDPMIDESSRKIRVRIWLNHVDQRRWESNMFVNVELPVQLGAAIVVPREAVMDTGLRKIVFVCKSGNSFEPREIQTGRETDDSFEVKSGLKEGELIVVNGNFLLDSESRVQAGLERGATHE